ncbi:putative 16S rRNA (Cytosine(967)-C(5))-methyltransferase [Frankia sp. AgKG'84/4]
MARTYPWTPTPGSPRPSPRGWARGWLPCSSRPRWRSAPAVSTPAFPACSRWAPRCSPSRSWSSSDRPTTRPGACSWSTGTAATRTRCARPARCWSRRAVPCGCGRRPSRSRTPSAYPAPPVISTPAARRHHCSCIWPPSSCVWTRRRPGPRRRSPTSSPRGSPRSARRGSSATRPARPPRRAPVCSRPTCSTPPRTCAAGPGRSARARRVRCAHERRRPGPPPLPPRGPHDARLRHTGRACPVALVTGVARGLGAAVAAALDAAAWPPTSPGASVTANVVCPGSMDATLRCSSSRRGSTTWRTPASSPATRTCAGSCGPRGARRPLRSCAPPPRARGQARSWRSTEVSPAESRPAATSAGDHREWGATSAGARSPQG